MDTQENLDVIAVLKHDHREVEAKFARLESRLDTGAVRKDRVDQVIIELVGHSVAEEQYLYPAVREHVPGGADLADKELADHAAAELLMKRLEAKDTLEAGFEPLLAELMTAIRAHIAEEENTLFPRLTAVSTPEYRRELGEKIRASKKHGPTRPHPGAPDTAPANKIAAPALGLIDRVRDAVTGRGKGY